MFKHATKIDKLFYSIEFLQSLGIFGFKFSLVLYLVNFLNLSDANAYQTYAAYAALAYGLSSLAGIISEKLIGIKTGMLLGCLFMMIGFAFILNAPSFLFYIGLGFLVMGTSFYRTTTYDLIGKIYADDSHKAHLSYNNMMIFTNTGAVTGTALSGAIADSLGWTYVFLLMGGASFVASLLLLKNFMIFNKKWVQDYIKPQAKIFGFTSTITLLVALPFVMKAHHLMDALMPLLLLIVFIIGFLIYKQSTANEKTNLIRLLILFIFLTCFNTGLEQLGGAFNLYIDRAVNTYLWGVEVPTQWFVSLNPFFYAFIAFMLAPYIASKGNRPYIGKKIMFAFIAMIIGFSCFYLSSVLPNLPSGTNPLWVIIAILFYTVGEAVISPVSLAMITLLAPKSHTGFFMGIWFLCFAWANYFGGEIAKFISIEDETNLPLIFAKYQSYFLVLLLCLIGITLLVYFFSQKIDKQITTKEKIF